jgi:hypothetical protein
MYAGQSFVRREESRKVAIFYGFGVGKRIKTADEN